MMYSDTHRFEEKNLGQAHDFGLIKKLSPYMRPYWILLCAISILIILITLLELSIPYISKIAIDRYIVPEASQHPSGPDKIPYMHIPLSDPEIRRIVADAPDLFQTDGHVARIANNRLSELPRRTLAKLRKNDLSGITHAAIWLLMLVIINFVFNFLQVILMEIVGQKMMHDLRIRLFSHIQSLSVHFFTINPVGRLVTRVSNDVQNMNEMFTSVMVFVIKDIFMLTGITVVLFSINWRLSLTVYSVFPLVFYISYRFSRSARKAFRTLRVKIAEINSRFSETIGGMQVIQLFRREDSNYHEFKKTNEEHYLAGMQQITVFALFMPIIEMLSSIALAGVIFFGGKSILSQQISLGTLVVFISYIRMFFRPIRDIAEKYNITLNALSSAERMFLILEDSDKIPEAEAQHQLPIPHQITAIAFKTVSFSYIPGEIVLKDISFSIAAGETIAIVGPTGAGKTSLIHMITRFYDPDTGAVTLNDQDIRKFKLKDLRSKIAIVPQDPYIFSGSLKNNIFNPAMHLMEQDIHEILETACCIDMINKLPDGLNTEMAESGSSLSSGERQLISIARALAHHPELIIFDEATSYVDSETENKISSALSNLVKHKTLLIIAHRLSTARMADRIIVMHSGKIIETGTHDQLTTQKGFYNRLQSIQG